LNSLVIFTRNDLEGIKSIFSSIPVELFDEIFAVDGHSADGTVEFLHERGIKTHIQSRIGRVNATIEALKLYKGDVLVFLSGDANENPRDIKKMLTLLDNNDMVVASRFMISGASDDSDDPLRIRKCASLLIALVVNLIWGANITDATNGLRAVKREVLKKLTFDEGYHTFELQLTILAAKMKYHVAEVPTIEGRRKGSRRYASTVRMALSLSKILLKEIVKGRAV
jgi:glycosyltransferase involved in cell wall biosynthesis